MPAGPRRYVRPTTRDTMTASDHRPARGRSAGRRAEPAAHRRAMAPFLKRGNAPRRGPATGKTLLTWPTGPQRTEKQHCRPRWPHKAPGQPPPPRERGEILRRAYESIVAQVDELALLMTLEMGKPLAEARGEVAVRRRVLPLVLRGGRAHRRRTRHRARRPHPHAADSRSPSAPACSSPRGTSRWPWAPARSAPPSPRAAPWSSSRPSRPR